MAVKDELGNRMKEYYENIPKAKLMRRTPVIIRLDGKAFHTFTKKLKKPFDDILMNSMSDTMKYLCENIQGCVLGYCQSDEISLVLQDYKELSTAAWFDYEVQKVCSIAASMATLAFNKNFINHVSEFSENYFESWNRSLEDEKLFEAYNSCIDTGAMFDARCFNIPKEEVANYFYWRQLDATRNSIQMVGQSNFTHKELQNKSCNQIQDMLMVKKNINWNNLPTAKKRGSCCIKSNYIVNDNNGNPVIRSSWAIDNAIPIFVNEGRDYIERRINIESVEV